MATTHKIVEDFSEDSFELIAVHSSLEDYAVVYAINLYLKSNFRRSRVDLDISRKISFPLFEWKDRVNDQYWMLIRNSSIHKENDTQVGLFLDQPSFTTHHLVPEYKEVDYFLKIEQHVGYGNDIVKSINAIPKIVAAYTIDADQLKSKNNLIF